METTVTEIADGIYRLSTLTDAIPGGFTFNQFLVKGDDPLLFHTGPKGSFPLVSDAVSTVVPVATLRWVTFGHWEADESGALNDWLAAAPHGELAVGALAPCSPETTRRSDRRARWRTVRSSTWAASACAGSTHPTCRTGRTPGCCLRRPPGRCCAETCSARAET